MSPVSVSRNSTPLGLVALFVLGAAGTADNTNPTLDTRGEPLRGQVEAKAIDVLDSAGASGFVRL